MCPRYDAGAHFFALKEDLLPLFEVAESKGPLQYVLMEHARDGKLVRFAHGAELPQLGIAAHRAAVACAGYLVTYPDIAVQTEVIDTCNGRVYPVNQALNPHTVTLWPGGMWGDEVLLEGRLATIWKSAVTKDLMTRFGMPLRKRFRCINYAWVGPRAMKLLENGKRLCQDPGRKTEYDLRPAPDFQW